MGYQEIMQDNHLQQIRNRSIQLICDPKTDGANLYGVEPFEGEEIIETRTFDPFSESRLEIYLKKHDIKRLIIVGVNTEVSIESALRTANSRGYEVMILSDLVASNDQEQHRLALERFKYFGTVTTSDQIL